MFNEPPYAERHVRWCERTVREIIPYFLLDFESMFYHCMLCRCGYSRHCRNAAAGKKLAAENHLQFVEGVAIANIAAKIQTIQNG